MQVSIDSYSKIYKKILFSIPRKYIQDKIQKKINSISSNINISGFRTGKAPKSIIQKFHGNHLQNDVIQKIIKNNLYKVIVDNNIMIIGSPKITINKNTKNSDLVFSAIIETYPSVNFDIKNIEIEKIVSKITKKDIDKMINKLRKQHPDWKLVKRISKLYDKIVIDFNGSLPNKKKFQGSSGKNVSFILGQSNTIDNFMNQLYGLKEGEKKKIHVSFPKNYKDKIISGKTVIFDIFVKKLYEPVYPILNNNFSNKFNFPTLDMFFSEIQKTMENQLENLLFQKNKENLILILLKHYKITDIPPTLIKNEIDFIKNTKFKDKISEDIIESKAKERAILNILFTKAVEFFKITVSENQIQLYIDKISQIYENPKGLKESYLKNIEKIQEIKQNIQEKMVVEALFNSMNSKFKNVNFYDLMENN